MDTGIYYGFANVDGGPVYKMVMSIGWNPFYKNIQKSMVNSCNFWFPSVKTKHYILLQETHILHIFTSDFYGKILKVCILGYIRPEQSYDSLGRLNKYSMMPQLIDSFTDALIQAIKSDIAYAEKNLDSPELKGFMQHSFFGSGKPNATTSETDCHQVQNTDISHQNSSL